MGSVNPEKIRAGRLRVSSGKEFEKRIIADSRVLKFTVVKIPEKVINLYNKFKPAFQTKTPFDFACGVSGHSLFLDAKSTNNKSLNIKTYLSKPKALHQYRSLVDAHNNGDRAGYLVYFRTLELITFFPIEIVHKAMVKRDKALLPDQDGSYSQPADKLINLRLLCFRDLGL